MRGSSSGLDGWMDVGAVDEMTNKAAAAHAINEQSRKAVRTIRCVQRVPDGMVQRCERR